MIIYSSLVLKICKIKDNGSTYLENFKIWWEDEFNTSGILLLLIGIIVNFLYRLFYFLIIKNLTAIHIIFSFIFYANLLSLIGNIKKDFDNPNNNINIGIRVYLFIINLLIFVGLLIYLEMIELDFCSLNYNLRKSIIERSIQDYKLEIYNDNEEDEIKD